MLKIAICDDNKEDLGLYAEWVRAYAANAACEIRCFSFDSGDALIAAVERGGSFDIIFFDVIMPGVDGIETAKEVRQVSDTSIIVFLTVSREFALESYEVRAHDYLLKPVTQDRFLQVLNEVVRLASGRSMQSILLQRASGVTKILFESIRYVEVMQKRLYFYLNDGSVLKTTGTIGSVEKTLLAEPRFLKPHRSYLVNMEYIETVGAKEIRMTDGQTIPLPKALLSKVKEQFLNYYTE